VSHRVYILLDVAEGKSAEAAQSLCDRPGVVKADLLEGSPDILVICEAFSRQKLAKLAVGALAAVEQVTENVSLLPVRSNSAKAEKLKLSGHRKGGRETLNA
jgi:hypothetical protein